MFLILVSNIAINNGIKHGNELLRYGVNAYLLNTALSCTRYLNIVLGICII